MPEENNISAPIIVSKTCTKCQVEQPLENFGSQSASRDGKKSYCKPCFASLNKNRYEKKKKHIIRAILKKRAEKKREEKLEKETIKTEPNPAITGNENLQNPSL